MGRASSVARVMGAADEPGWIARLDRLHLLTPLRIVVIVAVCIVATWVLRRMVSRILRRALDLSGGDPQRADARQRALATALRSAFVGVVWAAAVITIISELGVNIGGVVATATVIGGAVAFGAQTLVRDTIAGFFVLAEDQYGVGDDVDLGLASGSVERITLRTVRLRDDSGRVWHVPHGNVMRVANLSKVSLATIDVEVSRESDPAAVDEVLHRIAVSLADDPQIGPVLLETPRVLGLVDVRNDRLVFRSVASTSLGHHDDVRRRWRLAVLEAFRSGELAPPPLPRGVRQQD